MKRRYYVAQCGYSYPNPEPLTLAEARKELSDALKQEKEACKRVYRNCTATIHRPTKDCGSVTLAPDKRSSLWAAFSIQPIS